MAHKLFSQDFVLLDGAMGTILQQNGLKLGEIPELLSLSRPELIQQIHRDYLQAGSQVIYANTFGANRHKLAGCGHSPQEVITKSVELARAEAHPQGKYVALDIGPIGTLLEPSGSLSFEEAYHIFAEMIQAGAKAGADLVVLETMTDLYEVKAGVLACREHCNLPLLVSMTFEDQGRTFTGCSLPAMALTLQGLGVDALGLNCSLGPKEMLPLVEELASHTSLPLLVKANAGLPHPETGEYHITPQEFAQLKGKLRELGVQFLGGCCGTTPDFIAELAKTLDNIPAERIHRPQYQPRTAFCSATQVVTVDTVRVIGERLNPTGKKAFAQALAQGDLSYVLRQALEQVQAGAEILDVNVGVPDLEEAPLMARVVKELQAVVTVPLQIDSSNIQALEAGLRVYNGKPILNSVNGEEENLERILPLAKKYGAAVVALTIDRDGIPKTAEKRVEIALKIKKRGAEYQIPPQDILVDCLALTVSAQQKDCLETLKALEILSREEGLTQVLGVSNISFGLPNRPLLNHSFLTMAMARGLTLPILNPNATTMMEAVLAHRVFTGYDRDSQAYLDHFASFAPGEGKSQQSKPPELGEIPPAERLKEAILQGLEEESRQAVALLLDQQDPMTIVNQTLIPSLDLVGEGFEAGTLFLPQLLRSAGASLAAFEAVKLRLSQGANPPLSQGKILLATVHGDVHDIGKNIVKVILENYGYQIFDLGKDVPAPAIVDCAIREKIPLIGLSALMTTTVASMKETIALLRQSGHPCKIMVGGAVLTEDYARKIGADYYAKDAKASVDIGKEVFS